ncbi:MAG: hypothetical protein HY958_01555 [Bacteroidia bacterium]|nr:hypothetical protein [Bacteroidia bacterium]
MKDIFVDTNIAKNLITPLNPEYKKFLNWLNIEGSLVVSNHLLRQCN